MKEIHFSIFEMGLLLECGIPVTEGYRAIIATHANPEVTSLFTDLQKDWDTPSEGFPYKMVKPFNDRKPLHEDFAIAAVFAYLGGKSSMVEILWRDMAYAFLLERKLASQAPSEQDIQVGAYVLNYLNKEKYLPQLLQWSSAENWKHVADTVAPDNIPPTWIASFQKSGPAPLPTLEYMRKSYEQSGALDRLPERQREWNDYTGAYNALA